MNIETKTTENNEKFTFFYCTDIDCQKENGDKKMLSKIAHIAVTSGQQVWLLQCGFCKKVSTGYTSVS